MPLAERFDQRDLARQVIGGVRRDAVQFREQLRRDPLRLGMRHAVHHAVPGPFDLPFDRREDGLPLKPLQQKRHRCAMVGCGETAGDWRRSSRIVDDQVRAA